MGGHCCSAAAKHRSRSRSPHWPSIRRPQKSAPSKSPRPIQNAQYRRAREHPRLWARLRRAAYAVACRKSEIHRAGAQGAEHRRTRAMARPNEQQPRIAMASAVIMRARTVPRLSRQNQRGASPPSGFSSSSSPSHDRKLEGALPQQLSQHGGNAQPFPQPAEQQRSADALGRSRQRSGGVLVERADEQYLVGELGPGSQQRGESAGGDQIVGASQSGLHPVPKTPS